MRKSGLSLRSSVFENFQDIMDSIHQHRYRLVRGARKLLETVRDQRHPMILYTRGDQQIQENIIHQTKISTFFQKIYITKRKTSSHLQQILDEMNFDPTQSWMIGDEILTDVNHALECGMNVMRVWGYHNYEPAELPASPKIINVLFLNHLMPHFSLLQKETMSIKSNVFRRERRDFP
ncbi:HAD family hydrolase [Shimazuella alba]|uniref:HAD hydrolase-like protein n=1 Tax=Shimazuella alba TaxID=2690964 RepID=A0A6I4VTV2_9BACL|nr:HAD hydrolase-like protein [Shimazuella alba]MXQ53290.1 HAD hydrolase-like protein [Shimazuella alba]